jgi:tetratricopeptide (TPR) repeat protein
MARGGKTAKRRSSRSARAAAPRSKALKTKPIAKSKASKARATDLVDPRVQQQLKVYEEALHHFQQQKWHKAKELLQKVVTGPGKELSDRAQMHLRICEQRISRSPETSPRTVEEHYQRGVAMMNLGRWDEAREHLLRARKLAPKADYVIYAMAALDCLTGDAESAMENLKVAIELRPENRYHARNDEDFAFLQEDPRFTELLYPEREGAGD